MDWVLVAGCAVMTAAAWWCHLNRYPAFRTWGEEFERRHRRHTLEISLLVIPGMFAQIGGTAWVVYSGRPLWLQIAHIALCLASIGPTLLVSGPIHGKLANGHDAELVEKLIRTNLPRTLAWTAQFALAVVLVAQ